MPDAISQMGPHRLLVLRGPEYRTPATARWAPWHAGVTGDRARRRVQGQGRRARHDDRRTAASMPLLVCRTECAIDHAIDETVVQRFPRKPSAVEERSDDRSHNF